MPWILLIIVENWKRAMHCVTTLYLQKVPTYLLFIYLQSEWKKTRYSKYRKYQNFWMNNKARGE